jgi:hypothetical protein
MVAKDIVVAIEETKRNVQSFIAATAKRLHAEVMATDPRPTNFRRWVDGVEGAREERVKPSGIIQYRYSRLELVAQFAMETLFDKSPVGEPGDPRPGHPGFYRNNHIMYLNGVAVTNLKDWKAGDEIAIANAVPYSRVIELGKMKMRVPGTDHVYQQAEQIVKRRYGNVANIRFTFRGIGGLQMVGGRLGNKSDNRYPALVITER